jgi:hypothetical protein
VASNLVVKIVGRHPQKTEISSGEDVLLQVLSKALLHLSTGVVLQENSDFLTATCGNEYQL